MTTMTFRRFRFLASLGFFLLIAASVALTLWALRAQQDDAVVINLAGRQRTLTQLMTLEALDIQVADNPTSRRTLRETADAFEQTLNALVSGGPVPYTDRTTVTLPPTRNPAILTQLESVRAVWLEMRAAITGVLDSDRASPAFAESVATVERLSPLILSQMDEAVRLYEAEAERKVARVRAIQLGFLGTATALLLVAFFLTDRWLLTPLARLDAAARRIGEGDLRTPVSAGGLGEVHGLARGFDDMRQRLAASREALERGAAELDSRVAARMQEIAALGAIAQAANRHVEIGPLLAEVLPLLTKLTSTSAAWVTLLVEDPSPEKGLGKFVFAGGHNLPPALEADEHAAMRWSGCACQRKLLAGELTRAMNILECDRLHLTHGRPGPAGDTAGLRYHASAPIRAGERVLGVLNLAAAAHPLFSDDELRVLNAIGDQIGMAIERARLHEQVKAHHLEEQAALLRLSQALLGETEAQAVMDVAARATADALGVEIVTVALIEADGASISARASLGWPPEILPRLQRIPLEAVPALTHAIRTREPVVILDEARETRFPAPPWLAEMGIVSSLLAPMLAAGKAIGGLVINSRTRRNWSDDEVRLLSLIANDTAQALERARLYAHAQERLERITALHEIDMAITSHLGLQARLDILLEKVTERLRVDAAAVALVNPETHELTYAARRGLDGEFFGDGVLKVKESVVGEVAHSGAVAAIPDVREEPRFARRAIAARLGLVSYLAIPLRARGELIGILELVARERHIFPPEEIDFFTTLASQAAIAIDSARMFEAARRRAAQGRALAECAAEILAALDTEALWPAVMAATRQTLSADRAAVYVYDAATDRVTCPHASGLSAEYVAEINRRFREVPGGRLLRDPQPIAIADAQTDPAAASVRDLAAREGFHAYAVFPLIAPGASSVDTFGALAAYRDAVAPFTSDDIVTGQTLAHIVSVALQNARLFQTEREQRELAEALRDALGAGAALSATLDFDTVLDRLLDQIARVVPYDAANVMLLDAPTGRIRIARQRGYDQFGEQVVRDIAALSFDIATTANLRWMAETGQPLVIPDTAAYPGWVKVEASAHVRSWAGAPIIVDGQVIAFFSLDKIEANFYRPEHGARLAAFAGQAALALKNARLFEAERAAREQAETLREVAQTVSRSLELDEVLHLILKQLKRVLTCDTASVLLFREEGKPALVAGIGYADEQFTSRAAGGLLRHSPILSQMARDLRPVLIGDVRGHPGWIWVPGAEHVRSFLAVPIVAHERMTGALMMDSVRPSFFTERDARLAQALAQHMAMAIENARLFDEIRRRAAELEALAQVSSALRQAQTREAMLPLLVEKTMQLLRADAGALLLLETPAEQERLTLAVVRGPGEALVGQSYPPDDDPLWQVARTGEPIFVPDVAGRSELVKGKMYQALMAGQRASACVPLKTAEDIVGVLHLACRSPRTPTESEMRLLTSIAEIAGNALHRAALHEQTERRLLRLTILRAIDMAISASLDLQVTLNVLLDQITTQLRLDAVDVLLLNPHTQMLEYAVGRGFRGSAAARTHVRLGEGHAGRAALERRIIHLADLPATRPAGLRTRELTGQEAFVTYYAVPLIAKGEVKGVLEIFHRTTLAPDPEWLDFLEALAVQTAIAIDNAALFDNLQRSHTELALAYDTTIEGWSKALDLRDKETEGHTQRVTEMALRLARALGIGEEELVHLRRGALLHDIGKMGIPDAILLKAGPLTAEERAIMRLHPSYAYEMLAPIAYLRPALDIPYCHHEKWDGTGYPRGLKGEQIPLAARVFAVVDVWDALRSNRPYRPAWPEEKVRKYIRKQAGKYFDPQVVEAFLRIISE